jgi:hypothetical protein
LEFTVRQKERSVGHDRPDKKVTGFCTQGEQALFLLNPRVKTPVIERDASSDA